MSISPKIVLIGAYGYTGNLVAQELLRLNVPFTAFGKNELALQELQQTNPSCTATIVADICDQNKYKDWLFDTNLVINCAGPFNYYAEKLLDACSQLNVVYFDITGEQEVVFNSMTKRAELAEKHGATIVHSMSFESALTDLLLSQAMSNFPRKSYSSYNSYYQIKSKQMSPGTKITMKISGAYSNFAVHNAHLVNWPSDPLVNSDRLAPNTAHFVPYPEVIFAYKRIQPQHAGSYYLFEPEDTMGILMSANQRFEKKEINVQQQLERHKKMPMVGPTEHDRAGHHFILHTYLSDENEVFYQCISGVDPYGITAEMIGLGVKKYLEHWRSTAFNQLPVGFVTPAEFLMTSGVEWLNSSAFLKIETSEKRILANSAS
ncbi:MAG: hypothetical protein RL632_1991 [Bacteroidota bacterium]|jgi:short subunit dehydrogenase-like uncharacterized protein